MNKKITVISIIIILILFIPNTLIASSVQAETLKISNLITSDSISISNIKTMQDALNKANNLPQNIKYKLYDKGYTIKLQKDLIHLKGNKTNLAQGLNDPEQKRITIVHSQLPKNFKTDDVLLTQGDSITLLHEIGHTVDDNLIYSGSADFVKAFIQENRKLFNTDVFKNVSGAYLNYYAMYSDEYFTECFALYFNSKESKEILKIRAPMTYKYIDKIIKG
ncbi:MAG: Anthrax toxin lethal factor, and C-terminal domain [Clostridiaceae bacterium]|jgi:hypothetical protein|nr:Anthrax toxin lethal factor, and C-terminal domain [Clostridiaceae bacterium]